MTLFECHVPYVKVSTKLLHIRTRSALLHAIQMYKDRHTNPLTVRSSRYFSRHTRRQVAESRSELQRLELITDKLEYIDPPAYEQLMIPSTLNFNKFTMTETVTLIACYDRARGKHDAFSFTVTRAELAHRASLSERRMSEALVKLAERHLVRTETVVTNPGTKKAKYNIKVTLMDPRPEWSGWDLRSVGLHYKQREDGIPAHDRYDMILNKPAYSHRGHVNWFPSGPVDNFRMLCPFCKHKYSNPQTTFIFSSLTRDNWACARCLKHGDSKYLKARLGKYMDDEGPPRLEAKMNSLPDTVSDWQPEIEPMDATILEGDEL